MSGIFISYRRQDSDAYAGRLYDRLSTHFGKARVFMDIDMNLGIDFVKEIEQRVASCEVLIAVIGRSWLEVTDDQGRRRLDDPDDWVRLEITAALERDIPVIPTLVGGTMMPSATDLPAALSKLTRRQASEVSHTRFHPDVDRLIRGLERILPSEEKKTKQPATRPREVDLGATGTRLAVKPPRPHQKTKVPEGVYLDSSTRLMWTINDNGQDVNWHEANEYARRSRLGNYSDWRLPTIEELGDLFGKHGAQIRKPFRLTGTFFWSSTKGSSAFAWAFGFDGGGRVPYLLDNFPNYRALCVRRSGEVVNGEF